MRKWMRFAAVLMAMVLVMLCMGGCGKKEEPEVKQEATEAPEATPTVTPVPTPTPEPKIVENGFTFEMMDKVMVTTANLNVRSLPNTEGMKFGMYDKGAEVKVTGKCEETGWYRVDYKGQIGYVSDEYVE